MNPTGRPSKIKDREVEYLRTLMDQNPYITLDQMRLKLNEEFGLNISHKSVIQRVMKKKVKYSWKGWYRSVAVKDN